MDYFGCKNNFFSIWKKMKKFQEILGKFFEKKISGHKTPNFDNFPKFVNKNALKWIR